MLGTEHRVANYGQMSSELSVANEPQNSRKRQRILLPLEPDFSAMSDHSIILNLPTNTWESNRQISLNRQRRDHSKSRHKSINRRRYSSSSSSSSSTSSSLSSHKKSKKSKRSRHSHKKRRRHSSSPSSSSSSSSQSMNNRGNTKYTFQ